MITPGEAQALVPELAVEPFVGACYNPSDGIVFPWPFLWGYAHAAAKHGVAIHTSTPVTAIAPRAGGGFRITTPAGTVARRTDRQRRRRLVAGGRATGRRRAARPPAAPRDPVDRAAQAVPEADGDRLRNRPLLSQSLRGELVGGISLPAEDDGGEVRLGSRLAFLRPRWRARWWS